MVNVVGGDPAVGHHTKNQSFLGRKPHLVTVVFHIPQRVKQAINAEILSRETPGSGFFL